jgi:hypothetical protein
MRLEYYYALGVVLLCLAAYWFLRETDDPTLPVDSFGKVIKPPPKTRHQELVEARDKVLRQIEVLRSPAGSGLRNAPPNVEYEMAELNAVLEEINAELSAAR